MKHVHRFAFSLGVLAAAASQVVLSAPETPAASSAHITTVTGTALVSKGSDMVPALAGLQLEPQNRVFVLEDSSATVEFGDGCRQELPENAILTIEDGDTCASAESIERHAVAQGGAFTQAGLTNQTTGLLVIGGMAVGGIIWAATTDDDDKGTAVVVPPPEPQPPISP